MKIDQNKEYITSEKMVDKRNGEQKIDQIIPINFMNLCRQPDFFTEKSIF